MPEAPLLWIGVCEKCENVYNSADDALKAALREYESRNGQSSEPMEEQIVELESDGAFTTDCPSCASVRSVTMVRSGVKVVPMSAWDAGPAPQPRCTLCGTEHAPHFPHDLTSPMFIAAFRSKNDGQDPNWYDAMVHCDAGVMERWLQVLKDYGIDASATV